MSTEKFNEMAREVLSNTERRVTKWIAQTDAKAGEGLKIVGLNDDGTANYTHYASVAGADIVAPCEVVMVGAAGEPVWIPVRSIDA